jgi:hypothetical protein
MMQPLSIAKMPQNGGTMSESPLCPVCKSTPGQATYSTAPNQAVCPTDDCPIISWDQTQRYIDGVVGSLYGEDVVEP